ncbi:MAG: peptidoglycan-binding domain-containing protein [Verrucomicrobiota bacterium]
MRTRKFLLLPLFAVLSWSGAKADESLRSAQESLKTLGFYTGPVTGEMNADTKGALRRYQVHNGLEATGELTAETVSSLAKSNEAPSPETVRPQGSAPITPSEGAPEPKPAAPAPAVAPNPPVARGPADSTAPKSDREFLRSDRGAAPAVPSRSVEPPSAVSDPAYAGLFARTPFGSAPAEVQRDTTRRAQASLAQRGLFDDPVTGVPGPALEEALLRYQSSRKLPLTGRLDMDTLAALHLLPTYRGPAGPVRRPDGAVRGIPLD